MEQVLIFIVFFGVIMAFSWWSKKQQNDAWQNVAQEFDFSFIEGGLGSEPGMAGEVDGIDVTVSTVVKGSGKHKKIYTIVETSLSALAPLDMTVYREGLLQKVGKVLGGEDVQVNDRELDEAFIVKGVDEKKIRELLTRPSVKRCLLTAQDAHASLRIENGGVELREKGRTSDEQELRSFIHTVVRVTRTINDACAQQPNPTPEPQPQLADPQPDAPADPSQPVDTAGPFGRPEDSSAPAGPTEAVADTSDEKNDWW